MDYEGKKEERHVIIPSSNTAVDTDLMCAIQPGALPSKYSFQWRQLLSPSGMRILSGETETSVVVSPGEAARYMCTATIEHVLGTEVTYNGPEIIVNAKGEFLVLHVLACCFSILFLCSLFLSLSLP